MAKDALLLKYVDIPFAYALVTLVLGFSLNDFSNFQRTIPNILLFGSILATSLELFNPIKYTLYFLTLIIFRKKEIDVHNEISSKSSAWGQPQHRTKKTYFLLPIMKRVFYTESLSKSKDKIIAMVYFILIIFLTAIRLRDTIINDFPIPQDVLIITLDILIAIVFISIINELIQFPLKLYVMSIYLLKVESIIDMNDNFDKFEKAIDEDDWVKARYWARSAFLRNEFEPGPEDFIFWDVFEDIWNFIRARGLKSTPLNGA